VIGVLVQSLCAGVASGAVLCIGCDEGAWRISAPCSPDAEVNCCTIDSPRRGADGDSSAWSSGDKSCDCIDVPLIKGETVRPASSRAVFKTTATQLVPISIAPPRSPEPQWVASLIRAGPTAPPQLEPMSRRTVLLL
jgi:hypothetical protein